MSKLEMLLKLKKLAFESERALKIFELYSLEVREAFELDVVGPIQLEALITKEKEKL